MSDHPFIGQRIVSAEKMTLEYAQTQGMEDYYDSPHCNSTVLTLENGTRIYAQRDPEGNGIGTLVGTTGDGEDIYIVPDEEA